MADKPSRALVIYGDGCAQLVSPANSNLHSFASRAACGFLSLRQQPPPPSPQVPETENGRVIRDLAQLLDAYDVYLSTNENHGESDAPVNQEKLLPAKISDRFMGLRAAMFTQCPSVKAFASNLGFSILQLDDLTQKTGASGETLQRALDDHDAMVASELLQLLGFCAGDVLEKHDFDLVFLHIQKENTSVNLVDKLVGAIMLTAQPGSNISSRLHFSVVVSYDTILEGEEHYSLALNSSAIMDSDIYLLRPRQSYTMRGGSVLNDIRHHHPMLVAQWQDGVTRKDLAKAFSFREFEEHGGNLAMLADRFLHEVAFKLWKAPKYGA